MLYVNNLLLILVEILHASESDYLEIGSYSNMFSSVPEKSLQRVRAVKQSVHAHMWSIITCPFTFSLVKKILSPISEINMLAVVSSYMNEESNKYS